MTFHPNHICLWIWIAVPFQLLLPPTLATAAFCHLRTSSPPINRWHPCPLDTHSCRLHGNNHPIARPHPWWKLHHHPPNNHEQDKDENDPNTHTHHNPQMDTIRVRIWKALSKGDEMTLKQLGAAVGERRQGELRAHLAHVEKQAKTIRNKSREWKERRGLLPTWIGASAPGGGTGGDSFGNGEIRDVDRLRLKIRRGGRNVVYVRLG